MAGTLRIATYAGDVYSIEGSDHLNLNKYTLSAEKIL